MNVGADDIKRKNMKSHSSKCPQESVECPFADAGCKGEIVQHQLDSHMTSNQQQHLLLVMGAYKQVRDKLQEMEAKLTTAVQLLRRERKADKKAVDLVVACSQRLVDDGDSLEIVIPKFSDYCRSGKVWRSPPFYYREGYKMCLAVYANGVRSGAVSYTHLTLPTILRV